MAFRYAQPNLFIQGSLAPAFCRCPYRQAGGSASHPPTLIRILEWWDVAKEMRGGTDRFGAVHVGKLDKLWGKTHCINGKQASSRRDPNTGNGGARCDIQGLKVRPIHLDPECLRAAIIHLPSPGHSRTALASAPTRQEFSSLSSVSFSLNTKSCPTLPSQPVGNNNNTRFGLLTLTGADHPHHGFTVSVVGCFG